MALAVASCSTRATTATATASSAETGWTSSHASCRALGSAGSPAGGFVIANDSTYDASARTLAKQVGAVVIAPEYCKAPEHKFPASHKDAVAAYRWVTQNAAAIGGDPKRIAVAGESANLAVVARDQKLTRPAHELIVYPMAGTDLDTASYKAADSSSVMPLNKPMMAWFRANLTNGADDMRDPRLDIIGKADLNDLPPATVITD